MWNQQRSEQRVMVVGVVIATIVREHGPGAYGPAPAVAHLDGTPAHRTRAELEALVRTIASILFRAFMREAHAGMRSTVRAAENGDRAALAKLDLIEDVVRSVVDERARNIVAGCADLADRGELDDAWLGVLRAMLSAGELHNGGASVPSNLVELADEITALLYDGATPDDNDEGSGECVIDVEPSVALARVA